MTRSAGRALTSALLGGLAGIVWLALLYGLNPALSVTFDSDPPRVLSGLFPAERAPDGLTFAWTGEQLTLRLPGLDRRVDWILTLRVRGARANAQENPDLSFLADGLLLETHRTTTDYQDVQVRIPARPERRGATITVRVSRTFVPGSGDPRALGVMLDALTLGPASLVTPPPAAVAGVAFAAAVMGAAIALLEVTAGSAIGAAIVLALGIASVLGRGFGPYTSFPSVTMRASAAVAVALVAITALTLAITRRPLRNTARFVAGFSAAAVLLRLLALLHPDMRVGDALFQAHRFQDVLGGRLYFTSTAPGNYLFPYAPGLYVFAAAFSGLVARGAADMALLRAIVVCVDGAVALGLYRVIVKARGDRLAAAMAVALYVLVPLGFGVMTVGNLTNAFAQSVSVIALAMMAGGWLRLEQRAAVLVFTAVVLAAFLSHTSTFAILSVACFAVAVLFFWRGSRTLRSPSLAILVSLALAALLSVVLYYGHFMDTYRTELARLGSETAHAAPDAGGRGILTRLVAVPRYLMLYYGAGALALACCGAATLWRRTADRLSLAIAGWLVACGLFLLLGILTPVDMRYYLAAIPAVATLAAFGASDGWTRGGRARLVAAVRMALAVASGWRAWWGALGLSGGQGATVPGGRGARGQAARLLALR